MAEFRVIVRIASVCCTCVPGLLPHLQEIFVTSGATGTQKAFHLACVQISRAEALVPEPTAQVGQQPHLLTGGTWPVALVREFVGKANRKRRKWTRYPNLRRINRHEILLLFGKK